VKIPAHIAMAKISRITCFDIVRPTNACRTTGVVGVASVLRLVPLHSDFD
jgi:hypothetical protein